jgi:hypothetical protein
MPNAFSRVHRPLPPERAPAGESINTGPTMPVWRTRWPPHRVIRRRDLPTRFPLWPLITLALLLDRIHPPGWVAGAVGAVALGWLVVALFAMLTQEEIHVVPPREDRP